MTAALADAVVRAVIYCRLSPHDKRTKLATVKEQEAFLRRFAKRLGYTVVAVLVDDQASAYVEEKAFARPGFKSVCAMVANRECDVVLAVDGDRISRLTEQRSAFNALCGRNGVHLEYEDGRKLNLSSPTERAIANIEGVLAEMESAIKAGRVRRAREVAAHAGRPHPGPRPFGYNDDRRTLHPVEGPAYKELFKRVIAGDGTVRIAQDWHERGITNRRGNRFDAETLRKLVRAPRAIAKRVHRGEIVGDGDWQPIVTPEVQAQAIAALKSRRKLRSVGEKRAPRLLSSLVICAECNRPMRVRNIKRAKGYIAEYVCDKTKSRCCGKCVAGAEHVEREVELRLLARLRDPETLAAIERAQDDRPDVSGLLDDVQRLTQELEAYAEDAATGELSRTEYQRIRKGVTARLDAAKAALAQATDMPVLAAVSPKQVLRRWPKALLDDRRQLMAPYIEGVAIKSGGGPGGIKGRVDPDRVVVTWRF